MICRARPAGGLRLPDQAARPLGAAESERPGPPGSAPDRLTLDWNQAELAQYTRGDAIAITTYSAIFNLNSYLDDAQTLVFDDAHAAEGYVAEAWALSVGRE